MKIQGGNNVNFGWSCETHKQIYFGEKIQQDTFNKEKFEKEDLTKEDKKDFSKSALVLGKTTMTGGLVNAFSKIFNTNAVSFMDYNGRNNAKYAYKEQIEKMDEAIEDEDDELALQNAARACHFLEDMAQPQHIEETSALGKAIDLKIHTDYEKYAEEHAVELGGEFEKTVRNPRSSMKLFTDTFMETKETGKITRENEPHWGEITKKQFDIAVQATKEFLQNVSDQMGLEYREVCSQENHHQE